MPLAQVISSVVMSTWRAAMVMFSLVIPLVPNAVHSLSPAARGHRMRREVELHHNSHQLHGVVAVITRAMRGNTRSRKNSLLLPRAE